MTSIEIISCSLFILFSAYLSASEVALFSLSRFQIRSLKDRVRSATHRKLKKLLQDPGGLLITLLVLNEVCNVTISALITNSMADSSEHWLRNLILGTLVAAPIVLIVCDITPKVIGAKANQLVSSATVRPIEVIYGFMKPVRALLTGLVRLTVRATTPVDERHPDLELGSILKESEFMLMIEEGLKEGAIERSELDLIKNVFELDNTKVSELMTPLSQAKTLSEQTTIKNALAAMRSQRYSRIPVTSANRRQIVGMLYSKDLLRARLDPEAMNSPISELMRKPLVVTPALQVNALFRKFKQQKNHRAVVQRATGETLGIVTMSDVLESLLEDVFPDEEKS
jgi:putative hemolysin